MKKLSFTSLARWFPGLILFIIALFYLSNLPVNYDFDGTVFSQYLRYALVKNDLAPTHQPQHPLYIPVNYILYKSLESITGYHVLEYFHLQLFSLCFGLLTLWLAYKMLRKISGTGQYLFSIGGMVLAAFAYIVWYYSVEAEVHMAGLFFVTAGMYLLFFKQGDSLKLSRMVGACICFTLAVGFHLTNGLIAFSVLLIFILGKKPAGKIFRFFVIYGLFLLTAFMFFILVTKIDLLNFYKNELLGMDVQAGYKISYWSKLSITALWDSIKSTAQGILFPGSPALITLSLFFLAAGAVFIIYAGVKHKKSFYYVLGAWMLPYFIFFSLWDTRNLEFKLHVVFPFLLLITASAALMVGGLRNKTAKLLSYAVFFIFIPAIFFINFYCTMKPSGRIENNYNYQVAKLIGQVTPAQAIIVIAGCGDDLSMHNKIYISYFAGRKVFIFDWLLGKGMSLGEIRNRLMEEQAKGNPVYFFSDMFGEGEGENPALFNLLKSYRLEKEYYSLFLGKIAFKEKILLMDNHYLIPII
ncbi:MAG: hypothetical protein MUF15_22360 [Acidobacteria bacterium]|nr:hypothetical protein [Acidobacteriota bacterium]